MPRPTMAFVCAYRYRFSSRFNPDPLNVQLCKFLVCVACFLAVEWGGGFHDLRKLIGNVLIYEFRFFKKFPGNAFVAKIFEELANIFYAAIFMLEIRVI